MTTLRGGPMEPLAVDTCPVPKPDCPYAVQPESTAEAPIVAFARFETPAARREAIQVIVQRYGSKAEAPRNMLPYLTGKVPQRNPEDALGRYQEEIGQYRLLEPAEEQALFCQLERGLAAYRQAGDLDGITAEQEADVLGLAVAYKVLLATNMRLVLSRATYFSHQTRSMRLEDMVQEGTIGLAKAIGSFDVTRGNKFATLAWSFIDGSIKRALANKSRLVRIPVERHEQWVRLQKQQNELRKLLGREATDTEVSQTMDLSTEAVQELRRVGQVEHTSLNQPVGEDMEFGDLLADPQDPDSMLNTLDVRRDMGKLVAAALADRRGNALRDLAILSLRFEVFIRELSGIVLETPDGPRTYDSLFTPTGASAGPQLQEDIGKLFGLTRQRIEQVGSAQLKRLRTRLLGEQPAETTHWT